MKKHISWFRISLLGFLAGFVLGRLVAPQDEAVAWVAGACLLVGVQNEWLASLGRKVFLKMPDPHPLPESRFWRSVWFLRLYPLLLIGVGLMFGSGTWILPVWYLFHGYLAGAWILNCLIVARGIKTLQQKKWANPGEFALLGMYLSGGVLTGYFTGRARAEAFDQQVTATSLDAK